MMNCRLIGVTAVVAFGRKIEKSGRPQLSASLNLFIMMLKAVILLTALAVSSAVLKFPLKKIPDHEFVQSVVSRAAEGRK